MLKTLLTAMALYAPLAVTAPGGSTAFEQLEGFEAIVINHINAVMGSERLPEAMGLPVEPGVYVVVSKEKMTIFDRDIATLDGAGAFTNASDIPEESVTGSPRTVFDGFYAMWRMLTDEARIAAVEVPTRVLLAGDGELPAKVLLQAGYAASETRPASVPTLYVLVNGGRAGLRARPVSLLPPEGLLLPPGQRPLGLRVTMLGGDRYRVSAASASFGRVMEAASAVELRDMLRDIKRRNPGKDTLIVDAGEGGTVREMVKVMMLAQEEFSNMVLGLGQKVVIG